MQRLMLSTAGCVLALCLTGNAQAAGGARHAPGHNVAHARVANHGHVHAYYRDHGRSFRGGYYFAGREHHQWSRRVWDARLRCWTYYEPDLRCYYYWEPVRQIYVPVDCPPAVLSTIPLP